MKITIFVLTILLGIFFAFVFSSQITKPLPLDTQISQPLPVKQIPLEVVKTYIDLAVNSDFEKITEYTTEYPQEYFDAKEKEIEIYKKSIGEPVSEKIAKPESLRDGITSKEPPKISLEHINKLEPKELEQDEAFIEKVENVWVNGNEARVRVVIRSRLYKNYKEITDFLLYQRNGEWKIFFNRNPSLFNVYGIPNEKDYRYIQD